MSDGHVFFQEVSIPMGTERVPLLDDVRTV